MAVDGAAEMPRQELGAEADTEKRPLLPERHLQPVDLATNKILLVIGAHRSAEDDGAAVMLERLGQRIAETRAADVERIAAGFEQMRDTAGRGMLLVQDEQDRCGHV